MRPRRILVSDIDGTLLSDGQETDGLDVLRALLYSHRNDVALVYATGRTLKSVWELVYADLLPLPDAVAPSIGTELWFPKWKHSDKTYESMVAEEWNRELILDIVSRIPGLTPQSRDMQTPYKVSFEVNSPRKVMDLRTLLSANGINVNIIYSCGKYLDVVPKHAGKKAAVHYLSRVWGVPLDHVLTSGDSGNDLDMLTNPATANVLVANAESEMEGLSRSPHVYQATKSYAAGVVEGTEVLNFWP